MKTECNANQLEFHGIKSRQVVGRFDGGQISSDGGGILLREVEQRTGILQRLSECFIDYRNPKYITHTLPLLIKQRVTGLALGYEDLNDHDMLLPARHQNFTPLTQVCEKCRLAFVTIRWKKPFILPILHTNRIEERY